MNDEKGFTLLELIVTLAILGVLALILVPNFMSFLDGAKDASADANARNAYSTALATWTKAQADPDGISIGELVASVRKEYPNSNAVVYCSYDSTSIHARESYIGTPCTRIEKVELTTSGITASFGGN
ncbi:MAG: type II secretion system protein [Erysipelotrichaceae bacterium]